LRLKRKKVRVAFDSGILDFAGELVDPWMEEKNWKRLYFRQILSR